MVLQSNKTALDLEIQAYTAVLRRCFRGASWDTVSYYAGDAWTAADRVDARWQDVEARVRTQWEATEAVTRLRRVDAGKPVMLEASQP
jgi:hypothetical protein